MRKLLTILALGCLIFLSSGYYLLYVVGRMEARQSVKASLDQLRKTDVVRMAFATNETFAIAWEHNDEFRYGGEMYDVLQTEHRKDSVVYWCVPDKKESALVNAFLKTQSSTSNSPAQSLIKLLNAPFLPTTALTMPGEMYFSSGSTSLFQLTFSTTVQAVPAPPPRFC